MNDSGQKKWFDLMPLFAYLALAVFLSACGGADPSSAVPAAYEPASTSRALSGQRLQVSPHGMLEGDVEYDHFERNPERETVSAPVKRFSNVRNLALRNRNPADRHNLRRTSSNAVLDCTADAPNIYDLSGTALLDRLTLYHVDCMDSSAPFFALNANTYRLYNDANMQTVAHAVVARVAQYTPTSGQSIRQLLTFLRAGTYVAFYSSGALVHSAQTVADITDALSRFSSNAYFLDLSKDHANVIYSYVSLAGNFDSTRTAFAPTVLSYLAAMVANTGSSNYGLYSAQNGIYYFLYRGLNNNDPAFIAYMNNQPATLVTLLKNAAIYFKRSLSDDDGYYSDMAVTAVLGYTSLLAYSNHKAAAMDGLGDVLAAYPRLSGPWMAAVNNIDYYGGDCARYSVCTAEIKQEILTKAFPNTFSFDDGRVVIRTAIPLPKATQLYHAMKQVDAQYKRKTQESEPLPGDPNAVLNMYVYGSRAEYEDFQYFLFGLGTDNGGMYIEKDGTFYTYERTPADSIYTLEELLRHEYVHYLNGRFTIHGSFGETNYSNDRLTWFEEGSAEFFAGSTQAEGAKVRKIMVSQIGNDGVARMTLRDIPGSGYSSGFQFYRYAGLLFNYLDEKRPATLLQLFKALRANDIAAFDALVQGLTSDAAAQQEYAAYLDWQVGGLNAMSDFAEVPVQDPASLNANDAGTIQNGVRTYLPDALCLKKFASLSTRVGCSGTLNNGSFDARLDSAIKSLLASGVSNWKTLTCSYGNVSGSTASYYCEVDIRPSGVAPAVSIDPVTGTASVAGYRNGVSITKTAAGYAIADTSSGSTVQQLGSVQAIKFVDMTVNLGIADKAKTISAKDLNALIDLYVAFFNRVPDADGLSYWIDQFRVGRTTNQIADSFYNAAIQFSSLTGYSATMSNEDFVRVIYKNVLGRSGANAPPDTDVQYWSNELASGRASKSSLVGIMLASAHSLGSDPVWGWVAGLLDNKVAVGYQFAVVRGQNYNTPEESINKTMAIAAAVTPNDIASAMALAGISGTELKTSNKAGMARGMPLAALPGR